jgi:hypothetical protein
MAVCKLIAVGFDDPTLIDPLSAILNNLTQELDGDPTTFQQHLHMEYTSHLIDIPEHVVPIRISLIESCC